MSPTDERLSWKPLAEAWSDRSACRVSGRFPPVPWDRYFLSLLFLICAIILSYLSCCPTQGASHALRVGTGGIGLRPLPLNVAGRTQERVGSVWVTGPEASPPGLSRCRRPAPDKRIGSNLPDAGPASGSPRRNCHFGGPGRPSMASRSAGPDLAAVRLARAPIGGGAVACRLSRGRSRSSPGNSGSLPE